MKRESNQMNFEINLSLILGFLWRGKWTTADF